MKIVTITQARLSSSRLPEKVILPLGCATVLDLHLRRIKKAKLISKIIVASTFEEKSNLIKLIAEKNHCTFFQGDLNDVLDRFYQAVVHEKPDFIIRLTSDCPLIDPQLIDDLVSKFLASNADYAANCLNSTLPDGMDAEIFSFNSLEIAHREAKLKSEREHVTPYIRNSGKFNVLPIDYSPNLGSFRLTLDTKEDYNLIQKLVESLGENASMIDYINYLKVHPELLSVNSSSQRNEGYRNSLKRDNCE